MPRDLRLFQVGGFRAHTSGQPDALAARLCPPNGGIDLILGILPCGASYLLLREETFFRYFPRSRDAGRPWYSSEFRSLSPVYFSSREALEKKLKLYVHNKKSKGGPARDRSKANTAYTSHDVHSLTPAGDLRADHELQRVLYQLCRGHLGREEIWDFARAVYPRVQSMKVVSFAFTLWEMDRRPYTERKMNPKVLELGWAEFTLPTVSTEFRVESASHWVFEETQTFKNPRKTRLDFKHGNTEVITRDEAISRLKHRFSEAGSNVVLLVYDLKQTRDVLASFDIKISSWKQGLFDVFRPLQISQPSGAPRRRSLSPRRGVPRDPRQRPRSPERQTTTSTTQGVYIDIKDTFGILKQFHKDAISIQHIARDLGVRDDSLAETSEGWCAGNDSVLFGLAWQAMASGNAIDEQRLARWHTGPSTQGQSDRADEGSGGIKPSGSEPADPAPEDDESDFDPNDVAPMDAQGSSVIGGSAAPGSVVGMGGWDPLAFDDDD
ncbi:hypothetical protein BXZ70DRAFT_942089 [Cristinia sonorae]|uniref:Uncharacterized protein n=1 Tax=Cristinia sonorae TaxID=1940300 RepID=A0A8K0UM98_9AGAR|nr:hypothetical protein BXZ70DRAFT_942089 [Cristinia sonorae]